MDAQAVKMHNTLIARLLVVEAALDAVFMLAATSPELKQRLSELFATNVAATQEGLEGSGDHAAHRVLQQSFQRFAEALGDPPAGTPPG